MRALWIVVAALLSFSNFCNAEVRVAFFRFYDREGNLIQLEPNGQFAHLAIAYKGQWLHSYPWKGTVLFASLNSVAPDFEILTIRSLPDLTEAEVGPLLGLPYDDQYSWEDPGKTYCSKLVGKLLKLRPRPMKFEGKFWENRKNLPVGKLGLSPDEVYHQLIFNRGFQH